MGLWWMPERSLTTMMCILWGLISGAALSVVAWIKGFTALF
jgi:hypothetical protein